MGDRTKWSVLRAGSRARPGEVARITREMERQIQPTLVAAGPFHGPLETFWPPSAQALTPRMGIRTQALIWRIARR